MRCLAAAHLADDDPVRAHAQRVAHEAADRHLAATLEVRRPRLEPHHVRLLQAQLGRVLDRHDRSPSAMKRERALSVVVLPDPVPPLTRRFARASTPRRRKSRERRGQRPSAPRAPRREPAPPEAADREHRAVEGERRDDDVDARAVGQASVHERLGLVDAATERREDPLDRVAQLRAVRSKRTAVASRRPARSTHTVPGPLTITSSTAGSPSSGSRGPSPNDRSATRRASCARSSSPSSAASRSTSARMRDSTSPSRSSRASATSRARNRSAIVSRSSARAASTRVLGPGARGFAPLRATADARRQCE